LRFGLPIEPAALRPGRVVPLQHFPRTFFDRLLAPILQAARAHAKGFGDASIFPGRPLLAAIHLQKRVGMPDFPRGRLAGAYDASSQPRSSAVNFRTYFRFIAISFPTISR
jgi:hypothetical protein